MAVSRLFLRATKQYYITYAVFINGTLKNGTDCMKARHMKDCREMTMAAIVIFFVLEFTMPHKPRFHAPGPTVLRESAIYEQGVRVFNKQRKLEQRK